MGDSNIQSLKGRKSDKEKGASIAGKRFFPIQSKSRFFIAYTAVFGIVALLFFFVFLKDGLTFVWQADGLTQHHLALVYWGEYLREFFGNLGAGIFEIPMWDFNLGFGADIFTTMNYYVIGDPVNLFSVFFSPESTEILYNILVVARIYLAGVAFSLFCFHKKKPFSYVLIGAILYAFCGYTIYVAARHPFFINPLIYFPLVLLGIDRLLDQKKPLVLIFSVALSAASNFYFFYMITIFAVLYTIFRLVMLQKRKTRKLRFFAGNILKVSGIYLAGVLLAAVVFLPIVLEIGNIARTTSGNYISLLHYNVDFYKKFIAHFTISNAENYTLTGYTPLSIICLVVLFLKRDKKLWPLRILFLALTIFLMIPAFGYVFNGFAYPTNRWIFVYSMLIAYIIVKMLPELLNLSKTIRITMVVLMALYAALFLIIGRSYDDTFMYPLAFVCMAATFVIVLVVQQKKLRSKKMLAYFLIAIVTFLCIIANGVIRYSLDFMGFASEMDAYGTAYERMLKNPAYVTKEIDDDSFFRTEELKGRVNDGAIIKYNGTSTYFSVSNRNVSDFMILNGANNWDFRYTDLNARAYLQAYFNVKYYAKKAEDTVFLRGGKKVAGIETTDAMGEEVAYEALLLDQTLPFGYTYDSYLLVSDYLDLSMEERQQATMQCVVLEKASSICPQNEDISYTHDTIDEVCIEPVNDIKIKKNQLTVKRTQGKTAKCRLEFPAVSGGEVYVVIRGLHYSGEVDTAPKLTFYADVVGEKYTRTILPLSKKNQSYLGVHDYIVNLGYFEEPVNSCTVWFNYDGTYTFDSISIVKQPLDEFYEQADKLAGDSLTDVEMPANKISGSLSIDKNKIMLLAVPYSKGWSATVNGEPAELLKANIGFMALELPAGDHNIELNYETPGFAVGAIITLITFVGILVYVIQVRRTKGIR